jgi:voltage-gated potassium channel Kch
MANDVTIQSARGRRAYVAPAVLALVWIAVVISLGYIGFRDANSRPADRIYLALQLFYIGGSNFPQHLNWELQVARFLAPAGMFLTLLVGIQVITFLFVDKFRRWTLRINTRKHVVVCGLGRKGLQIVTDLRSKKYSDPVLVIDKDESNQLISDCDRLGAVVLIGDATKMATLRKAYIHNAKYIVATCGDDGVNIEIALRAEELLSKKSPVSKGSGLPCYVHIFNLELRTLFRQYRALTPSSHHTQLTIFNVYENSARLLFRSHFMDYQHPILREDDPRQAHLVVFGFGQLGESVVLQAVRLAHFPNGKKLRVTVIDKDATRRHNRFLVHYGSFHELCEADFIESDAEKPAVLDQVARWCDERNSVVTLAVCFDSDSHSLSFGLSLRNRIGPSRCPILVRMESHAGLAKLIADIKEGSEHFREIQGFAKIEEASSAAVVISDTLNALPRKVHRDFVRKRVNEGRSPDDPSMKRWEDLDPDLKDSNWQQAEHLKLKLRAITGINVDKIGEQDAEKLAKMEHNRWIAERCLAGWRLGSVKDVTKRIHPDLKPWQELESRVRQYDLEAVRLIPALKSLDEQP